jgi:hypothetical protein
LQFQLGLAQLARDHFKVERELSSQARDLLCRGHALASDLRPNNSPMLTLRRAGLSSRAYRDWLDYVIVEDGRDVRAAI